MSNPFEAHAHELIKPNSGHWKLFKEGEHCTLSEAVLLSLDIEPDWFLDMNEREKFVFNGLKSSEYNARLKTAKALGAAGALWVVERDAPLSEDSVIGLVEFGKAVKNKWDLPKEFTALIGGAKSEPLKDQKPWVKHALRFAEEKLENLEGTDIVQDDVCRDVARRLKDLSSKDSSIKAISSETIRQEPIIKELMKKYLNK